MSQEFEEMQSKRPTEHGLTIKEDLPQFLPRKLGLLRSDVLLTLRHEEQTMEGVETSNMTFVLRRFLDDEDRARKFFDLIEGYASNLTEADVRDLGRAAEAQARAEREGEA